MSRRKSRFLIVFTAAFLVIALAIISVFCITELKRADSLSSYTSETVHYFYKEKRDSLDGVYLGSSAANRYWAPAEAFEQEGICICNMGTYVQPFVATEYLIREALKSQRNMKVVVEIRNLVRAPGASWRG